MTYKAIFWDNDGILVDTEKFYFEANRRVFEEQGLELTLDQYRQFFLLDCTGAWHLLEELGQSEDQIAKLKLKRNTIYSELITKQEIEILGAAEVLEDLFSKYFMAVVTSAYPNHFQTIHKRTGFLKYFQFVLANGDYGRSKPYPDPYLKALAMSSFAAKECLVIEDSERGLRAATAAGIDCWVIPTELTEGGDFSSAKKKLSSITEIKHLL